MPGARVVAELAGDGTGFDRMLNNANRSLEKFQSQVNGVKSILGGLFAVGTVTEGLKSVLDFASHIKDLAKQSDLTTDEVQHLSYAARHAGLEFENFQTALIKIGVARKEAAEGNDQLLRSFNQFGIVLADLQNPSLKSIDLLNKMSDAVKGVNLSAGQRINLDELGGVKGFDKLLEVVQHLHDLDKDPIISKEDIDSLDAVKKGFQDAATAVKVFFASLLVGTAKATFTAPLRALIDNGIIPAPEGYKSLDEEAQIAAAKKRGQKIPTAPGTASKTGNPTVAEGDTLFINQRNIELAKMQVHLGELAYQNALKLMTTEERRSSLQKEINKLLFEANLAKAQGDPKYALELKIKREELVGQMEVLKQPKIPNDSLTRVGNFLGGGVRNIPDIQQRVILNQTKALETLTVGINKLGDTMKKFFGVNPFVVANPNGVPPV